jgi:hypothetical protein
VIFAPPGTDQNQAGNRRQQSRREQDKDVRILIRKSVRMGRPGLMGAGGGQQSEASNESESVFHALMVCSWRKKSSSRLGREVRAQVKF